jgi:hypothetical protein
MNIPPFSDQKLSVFFDELKRSSFVTTTKAEIVSLSNLGFKLNDQDAALMPNMYMHRRMIVSIYFYAKSAIA